VSHPDGLPDLFLDRSLGRKKVPELLRAEGLRLITLAEHYGIPSDETVEDVEWLQLCGDRRWLAVMKDDRIRYVGAERRALVESRVRAAVVSWWRSFSSRVLPTARSRHRVIGGGSKRRVFLRCPSVSPNLFVDGCASSMCRTNRHRWVSHSRIWYPKRNSGI
jgi:PIN like domain